MHVVVLGAGVIGVTTAYYLTEHGVEVTVLDRQPGPGMETSFANAGELSYGMTSPWAAPGIPMKALKWLFMKHRPLFIWPLISPTMWAWVFADARQLQRRQLCAQQKPYGAYFKLQPGLSDRAHAKGEPRLRPAGARNAPAVSNPETGRGFQSRPGGSGRVR